MMSFVLYFLQWSHQWYRLKKALILIILLCFLDHLKGQTNDAQTIAQRRLAISTGGHIRMAAGKRAGRRSH